MTRPDILLDLMQNRNSHKMKDSHSKGTSYIIYISNAIQVHTGEGFKVKSHIQVIKACIRPRPLDRGRD